LHNILSDTSVQGDFHAGQPSPTGLFVVRFSVRCGGCLSIGRLRPSSLHIWTQKLVSLRFHLKGRLRAERGLV
jgi:hypothetical protein